MTLLTTVATKVTERAHGGRRRVNRAITRVHAGQDYVLANVFRPYGVTALYWGFAIVFFYFGFQKPSPAQSPVRVPLSELFPIFGIPLAAGMLFIGTYEMFLGLLFLFRQIRVAFWLFIPHQLVTFLSLAVIPFVAFQPPYIPLFGVDVPWATTGYGEFVVKNVVFVAGFMLLASIELGDDAGDGDADDDGDAGDVGDDGDDGDVGVEYG